MVRGWQVGLPADVSVGRSTFGRVLLTAGNSFCHVAAFAAVLDNIRSNLKPLDISSKSSAKRHLSSFWTQVGQGIVGESSYDYSGYAVSLSSDGLRFAIGAYENDANGSFSSSFGHVRVFDFDVSTSTWIQVGQDIDGERSGDYSGFSVDLSSDGSRVVIGAPYNDKKTNSDSQSATLRGV